jgi:hypothetical protein
MTPGSEQANRGGGSGEAIIVVSGLPRSGTSMTMKMLAEGGIVLLTDGVRVADESNPQGYYEFEKVKQLDQAADLSWLDQARGKAVKIISFLLPHLPDTLNYRILFMHRDLHEVIASQNRMLVQRGEPTGTDDDRMLTLFADHVKKISQLIATRPCFDVIDIDHHDVLHQPSQQATRINDFLGGGLDVERMAAAVDQRLYRNRAVR